MPVNRRRSMLPPTISPGANLGVLCGIKQGDEVASAAWMEAGAMTRTRFLDTVLRSTVGVVIGAGLVLAGPTGVAAATLNVCASGCPYAQIGPALAEAHDGDTVRVGPGRYAGGLTIAASVKLVGAGAGLTIIKGGGPVISIGTYLAPTEPTVSISGLTITGGVAHSAVQSVDWFGEAGVIASGGGVEIVPNADFSGGATVTISHSVITGNLAAATDPRPFGPPCPSGPCPFAWSKGGGIDNFGALTLVDTTVSNNIAAGLASDANGGGINDWRTGRLTLTRTSVTGNQAIAAVPDGRYAEGGGIFTDEAIALTISDSVISDNTASLTSTLPFDVGGGNTLDMNANGGGVHVGDGSTVRIDSSVFRNNLVNINDPNGEPYGFDSALHPGDSSLVLRNSAIVDNRLVARVGSSADVGPSGTAVDINGPATVSDLLVSGNSVVLTSDNGAAEAAAAGIYIGDFETTPATVSNMVVTGNKTTAWSNTGSARIFGSGLLNEGRLILKGSLIADNVGVVHGRSGLAQGAGIWNGSLFDPTPDELTLNGTIVTHNILTGPVGATLQGGGLYTVNPVTVQASHISHNEPDDCFGC